MNDSVTYFYCKEDNPLYHLKYEKEHSGRINFLFDRYNLDKVKNQTVADFGCGHGILLSKFDSSNKKLGFDGASIHDEWFERLGIKYLNCDLELPLVIYPKPEIDISICTELLEHLANPYQCLITIKNFTQLHGYIYISIPHEKTLHNTIYPGLFYPESNFEQFLEQMALQIEDKVYSDHSFPSWIYKTTNLEWKDKRMKFHKNERKFDNVTPLELTNL